MRLSVAVAAVCLSIVGLVSADDVRAAMKKATNIPAEGLVPALKQLAHERNLQVVFQSEVVGTAQTHGAAGELTTDEALSRLLEGTNLSYRFLDDKTITVFPASAAEGTGAAPSQPSSAPVPTSSSQKEPANSGAFLLAQVAQGQAASAGAAEPQQNQTAQSEGGMHEVIVTAQKREEHLKDVPISMSVLRGDDLDKSTAPDVAEELSRVPGVSISKLYEGGASEVSIRGVSVGQPQNGGASTTAYYLDTVPFGFVKTALGPDLDAYDINRIEVLRGPQGTLYGASALNGVVRVLTMDANLDEFEVKGRALTSTTEDGSENWRGDAAVNVPIVDGKLAARVVVSYQDLSGWIDKPKIETPDANDGVVRTARLKINAQPTDQLSIGAFAWRSWSDFGAPDIGRTDTINDFSIIPEPISTEWDAYGLKIGYDFSGFSVTSMTSYLDYLRHDILSAPFTVDEVVPAHTFAQELVLNSTQQRGWRWTAGGMYRNSEDRRIVTDVGLFPAPQSLVNLSKSYAAYGELTRIFFDGALELTGGLRHFEDQVGLRELSETSFVQPVPYIVKDDNFHATTPRVALTWLPSEQLTAYTSYSQGFRSGAEQVPSATRAGLLPIKPDSLNNYEVGAKGDLLHGRLNFDTAVYYMDWKNVQRTVLVPVNGVLYTGLVNGTSASGAGVDFGMTANPVKSLALGVNLGWNDLRMDKDVLSDGVVLFNKGNRLDLSPETTLGVSADYTFQIGRGGFEGHLSASGNYTSRQNLRTLIGKVLVVSEGDPMLIARTSFSVSAPGGRWAVTIFGDNLSNERGTPVASGITPDYDIRIRPRTVGVYLDYRM